MNSPKPLVSCLMVTRNRANLARRAVRCFAAQTWESKELIVIDDGDEDYESVLAPYRDRCTIHYHRFPRDPERFLGAARNLSLDRANGEFVMQWDDDEWYHPDRLTFQMEYASSHDLAGVVLQDTLMHVDESEFDDTLIRGHLRRGTPGTILHRTTEVRYPNTRRGEDSVFLNELRKVSRIGVVDDVPHSHLFIRCFHGDNTWERDHFMGHLTYRLSGKLEFFKAKYLRRDIRTHRAFRLSDLERETAQRYLAESRELDLLRGRGGV